MTTTEVREQLVKAFPNRTFAISETAWYHGNVTHERYVEYTISVQPGFNRTECQNFSDDSFEACLTKLYHAVPK